MIASKPTREEVRLAYYLLLGREPESEAIVDAHCEAHDDLASLRAGFTASAEFIERHSLAQHADQEFVARIARGYFSPYLPVEVVVDPDVAERLAARIREQWTKLGEEDPYWSVLTDEDFHADRIDAVARKRFDKSGEHAAQLIDLTAARTGIAPRAGMCVELGCGVGRITRHLAERFERVIAVDISPGSLALCERYLAEQGVANVETRLIRDIEELAALPTVDFFYSMIVLQHNPPPIQHRVLELLLGKIGRGGQCLFQTVADLPGYSFEAESYLSSPSPTMEIHSLPMATVHRLIRDSGLTLDTVRMDPWVSAYGSYTFSAHREGDARVPLA